MNDYFNSLLFGYYPYLVMMVFIVGSMMRYEHNPYSWKTGSSQLLQNKGLKVGSILFHAGIILLFFGHLFGLLTPSQIYTPFVSVATKQLLAMVAGGIFGSLCFVGLSILLVRRLFDARVRATSSIGDILILVILYIQLILGLISIYFSAQHMDGSSMVNLAHWAQHIVIFKADAASFLLNEHWIFKAHIFLGLTIFLVFPFTRLVHILSFPYGYLLRTGYQIVRKRV